MNLASWIILALVAIWIIAAIKITFFGGFGKKKSRGGCCDVGDTDDEFKIELPCAGCDKSSCSGCAQSAANANALTPTIRELK